MLSKIETHPGCPQVGPGNPVSLGLIRRNHPYVLRAGHKDLVTRHQILEIVAYEIHPRHGRLGLSQETLGQILGNLLHGAAASGGRLHPPDAVEVGMEPSPGDPFEKFEHPLPFPEGVHERSGGAKLERVGGHEYQMGTDTGYLGEDEPYRKGSLRNFQLHQPLERRHEWDLIGEAGDPVDSVD